MDFVKGNEIVKIDPHAIDLCGNNQITLGTEIITIDNKKTGTESSVTTLAPDYIKFGGYDSTQPNGQEGLVTFNRGDGKLTTYINGAWTNILTGTTSNATINDSRIKITGAHNTIANGIYNKNDSFSTNNANGDVYVNENGLYIEKDFNFSDQGNDPNWQQGPSNTDMEAYEYYVASDRTLDQHRANAASMNAHLTSIVSAAENQYIHDIIQASGVSSAIPERVFIGLQPAPGYDWYSDMGSGVDISIENSDSNNMNLWEWSDGTQYEPGYGNFTNWYWHSIYEYPINEGLHNYYTAGSAIYFERETGNNIEPPNKWVPAKSQSYRGVYKRRLKSTDIWKIYYDILGTKHTLYELYYTNTQNTTSLLSANIGSSDISGYDYINNKSISNDTINLSTITVNLDPAINIAVNHPIYGGTYTTATSLSNNHHLEWNNGNYKIAWATVDDNTNLNTNKLGWCLFDNSVIKYYSSGMTVDGITNGSSNPWDTDLRWEAVDGVNLTLPIINASNINTSLEKNLQDWVINITDSSYEKANGTYRRDRSENINNRHVYYNEHGLKLYYGALEYDGETPNNNTVTVSSYTEGDWVSSTSNSFMQTGYHGAAMDGNNPDALVGYEIKVTNNTYATWNDAEAAAQNEYAHLASFQTFGEADHIKRILDSASTGTVWFGMYYDGTAISSDGSDPNWKFTDRTRTFAERGGAPTDVAGIVWETGYPNTSHTTGTFINFNRLIGNQITANQKAIFKRPQMWVQGTGSLTEYEYILVNVPGISWAEHESKAQELGGHLISIHSYEELQFIKTKFGSVNNNLFIGLRTSQPDNEWNATTNNDWYYTDGTPFDYQFWMANTYPRTDSNAFRYGTVGIYGWTASFTSADVYMFNNRSNENCIAIYKRKRNSWRIVDGKDTIYRFGEPTVTNTGSYVDSVTSLVMQPKYRNDHTDESSRVVDGIYVTRTVANLTITGHINTDYNGVYNYSNFKSDSTRRWVHSTTPSITLEYKETDNPLEQQPQYRWGIYNNNVLAMIGNIHINPWGESGLTVTWGNALPTLTRWGNGSGSQYQIRNTSSNGQIFNYNPDDVSDGYATTGQRGPGYLWNIGWSTGWGLFAFAPETYHFYQTPGVVIYHGVNQTNKNSMFISIYPANKSSAELTHTTSASPTDPTNVFSIHWSNTGRWYYYKEDVRQVDGGIADTHISNFQSIEITYEPDTDGVYQYYMNFFARSAGTDPYAVNYPYDVKTRVPGTDRYLLAGGTDNAFITHGFQLGYQPYRADNTGWFASTPGSNIGAEPLIYTRWIYHDKLYSECIVQKEVSATTNTETNLQITGQLSGAGPITSINVEHGITMTEGSTTVSVDKTNGVNIQNKDLAITDGNIIVSGTGKVGIGTSIPNSNLEIHKAFTSDGIYPAGNLTFTTNNSTKNWEVGGIEGYIVSNNGTYNSYPGGLAFKTKTPDNTITSSVTTKMVLDANGNVGIGTSNPTHSLHVVGDEKSLGGGAWRYISNVSTDTGFSHNPNPNDGVDVAIKSSASIWIYGSGNKSYFLTSSDNRIKTEIEIVNDDEALNMINNLETVKYYYRDPAKKNNIKTIGFLAQDVKEVIPNAVALQSAYIPDEMRNITEPQWEGTTLTIPDLDMSGAFTGKAKFYVSNDPSGNDEVCKEVEIEPDKKTFVFDQSWNNVFFYGKEVSDFHTIDKNQIFALHHSAIQELSRRNDQKTEKIQALEESNQQKDEKINALEARLNAIEQQLNIFPSEPPKTTTSLFKKV